jgi:hypothetical protein
MGGAFVEDAVVFEATELAPSVFVGTAHVGRECELSVLEVVAVKVAVEVEVELEECTKCVGRR